MIGKYNDYIIGIGTSKKWKGIGVKGDSDVSRSSLWQLNYNDAKGIVENKVILPIGSSYIPEGNANYRKEFNENSNTTVLEAYIYDKRNNIHVFAAASAWGYQHRYILADSYKLNKPEPNWEKVYKLRDFVWDAGDKGLYKRYKLKS